METSNYSDWMHVGDIVTAGGAMNGKCCLVTATYTDGTADVEDPFAHESTRADQDDLEYIGRPFCVSHENGLLMVSSSSTGMPVHILDKGEGLEEADRYLLDEVRKYMLEGYENQ